MPNYRLAKSLEVLRSQINAANPGRDKTSDGWIGDTSHKTRKSDHNPNKYGVVTAIDVDEDLSPGHDAMPLVRALQASGDPRIKYIIYEGKITVKGDIAKWKAYHGVNPHKHHFHISVSSDRGLYDDETPWNLTGILAPDAQPELRRGAKGEPVKRLQKALRGHGEMIDVDGDFGLATERAVTSFQLEKGLRVDGIAGRATNAALGL